MLSSPCLSLKRGPLGVIWLAAYFAKRLSKLQVTETNIPSSVDKILIDEWPSVSYRILAYLLLGVVRIFSKKVEFMLYDCHRIVNELNNFVSNKRNASLKELVRLPKFSITLPERYELDAFIVEVPDDVDRGHSVREEDIVLKDSFQIDGLRKFSFDEYHQPEPAVRTPTIQWAAASSSRRSLGAVQLENCCTPDAAADRSFSPKLIHSSQAVRRIVVDSLEEVERVRFTQEECLDFQMFYEQNEADYLEILNSSSIVASNVECIDEFVEVQIEDFDRAAEEDEEVTIQRCGDVETSLQNQDPDTAENNDACFTMMGTPETSLSCPFVATTPVVTIPSTEGPRTMEQLGIKTPANKERRRKPKKMCSRKPKKMRCLYDENMVLSHKSLKRCIDDATDLIRKRRKVCSILDVRRGCLISSFFRNFFRPLIPWSVTELPEMPQKGKPVEVCQVELGEGSDETRSLMNGADQVEVRECFNESHSLLAAGDQVEGSECSNKSQYLLAGTEQVEMGECLEKAQSSLAGPQSDIAPGTPAPAPCLASSRVCESPQAGDVIDSMRQSKSSKRTIRELLFEEEILFPDWTNEEMDQSEGDVMEPHGGSGITRNFANCLHQFFMKKWNYNEDGAMNLSTFLRGKMKKESARLFYEILVLKNGGYVNVKQDKPYSNILVRATPKWKQDMWGRDELNN